MFIYHRGGGSALTLFPQTQMQLFFLAGLIRQPLPRAAGGREASGATQWRPGRAPWPQPGPRRGWLFLETWQPASGSLEGGTGNGDDGGGGGRTRRRDVATVVKGVTTVRSTEGLVRGEVWCPGVFIAASWCQRAALAAAHGNSWALQTGGHKSVGRPRVNGYFWTAWAR